MSPRGNGAVRSSQSEGGRRTEYASHRTTNPPPPPPPPPRCLCHKRGRSDGGKGGVSTRERGRRVGEIVCDEFVNICADSQRFSWLVAPCRTHARTDLENRVTLTSHVDRLQHLMGRIWIRIFKNGACVTMGFHSAPSHRAASRLAIAAHRGDLAGSGPACRAASGPCPLV